jgi:hypothetical protein
MDVDAKAQSKIDEPPHFLAVTIKDSLACSCFSGSAIVDRDADERLLRQLEGYCMARDRVLLKLPLMSHEYLERFDLINL